MFKKLFIFLSFFFISAIPAFACQVTANPPSVPANTSTNVTFTVNNPVPISNFNYSMGPTGGTFSSLTQPSWASSCTNYTSNIGCYVPTLQLNTYDLRTVVNIPSDQTLTLYSAGDTHCTGQLNVNKPLWFT